MLRCQPSSRIPSRSRRGFTLIELGIVAAILSILGLVLVVTFSKSNSAISLGTAKIESDSTARIAVDRISPLVTAATEIIQNSSGGSSQLLRSGATALFYRELIFTTTEDFLDPTYNAVTWGTTHFNPLAPQSYSYVIYFFDPGDPTYLNNNAPDANPGEIRLMRNDATFAANKDQLVPAVPFRRLAGTNIDDPAGAGITDFRCRRLLSNAAEVIIDTRSFVKRDNGNTERRLSTFATIVQAPAESY